MAEIPGGISGNPLKSLNVGSDITDARPGSCYLTPRMTAA